MLRGLEDPLTTAENRKARTSVETDTAKAPSFRIFAEAPAAAWPAATRAAFRLAFAWFVVRSPLFEPLAQVAPWVGTHLLGLQGPIHTAHTGSGDRTVDWVWLLCTTLLAVLAAGLWTAADRAKAHPRLHAWLRVYLRYALAAQLISYGVLKLFKTQFPAPSTLALLQPYGESSPMRLLWTFMGSSWPYNLFTGGAEVLGGVLLFTRRTTTLGALVTAGVMANVVMLNLSYDVPVKIFSATLLLMALALLAPDARRLLDALVLGRATSAPEQLELFAAPRLRMGSLVLRWLVAGGLLFATFSEGFSAMREEGDDAKGPLTGYYAVEEFKLAGAPVPAGEGPQSQRRWTAAEVTGQFFLLRRPGETVRYILGAYDEPGHVLKLTERRPDGAVLPFTIRAAREGAEEVLLDGTFSGEALSVRLRRVAPPQLLLRERGLHWVNETPFNR
jgi:uncharacterized membrane protein YphA (DoxX/SURF4 family)